MNEYTEEQPKDGDIVLHCNHLDNPPLHFFKCVKPITAVGPDGESTIIQWLVCCNTCMLLHGADVGKIAWNQLSTWKGDEPFIEKGRS